MYAMNIIKTMNSIFTACFTQLYMTLKETIRVPQQQQNLCQLCQAPPLKRGQTFLRIKSIMLFML